MPTITVLEDNLMRLIVQPSKRFWISPGQSEWLLRTPYHFTQFNAKKTTYFRVLQNFLNKHISIGFYITKIIEKGLL